jgi:hypothetical protein
MTECCVPVRSIEGFLKHDNGCLAHLAGIAYHGPREPVKTIALSETTDEEFWAAQDRYWAKKAHPAKGRRRPPRMCAGFRHTCPHGECEVCLGL